MKRVFLGCWFLLCGSQAAADESGANPAPPGADPRTAIPGVPVIPSTGFGRPTPPPNYKPGPGGVSGSFGGSVLYEKIQEDHFATVDLFNQTTIGPVTFGLWVPLRFRVVNNDPKDPEGVIRKEDWDEVSDYAKILRFVEVNLGGDSWRFRGRFGALDGESLGHGTIVAGYYNSLDRNHYQAGLFLDSAIKWGGVEFMLDNLLGPEVFGFRLHTRPTSYFSDNQWLYRLIVGLTVAGDGNAPVALADTDGQTGPDVDDKGNFKYTGNTGVTAVGFDTEYAVIQNQIFDLVPYMDLNFLADGQTGAGFHLGFFFNVRIPVPLKPSFMSRLEYRAIGDGYAPRYFDTLYEAQRIQYDGADITDPNTNLPLTKLGWLNSASMGPNGWLGELYFDLGGWIKIGGTYEDFDGPNNAAITLGLHLPKLPLVQLGAYYIRRGFDDLSGAFDLDGALFVGYARAKIYGPLAGTVVYRRSWRAKPDGSYEAQSDFTAGVGLAFGY